MSMLWFFHLFSENVSFILLVGILAVSTHGLFSCAFQCWKPEVFIEVSLLWEDLGNLRQWHPWWLSRLRTGCWQPLGKARRRVKAHLLSSCSAHRQNHTWKWICASCGRQGFGVSPAASLSWGAVGEALSAALGSLSGWHSSGAAVHIGCSCWLERSCKQAFLNC